jgi:glycosyltransferase involved in cell wall biosynthesis
VVGHEYPSLPAWRATWETLGCDVATFQHWPYFEQQADAFDGVRSRLYCYSQEMRERYSAHKPIAELAVHLGLDEAEAPVHDDDGLLWMGRIDSQKAPHLAIRAAGLLGREITVAGPVFEPAYVDAYHYLFTADHVDMIGEVGGEAKMRLLAEAGVLIYTSARDHIEAGAASFGEALRAEHRSPRSSGEQAAAQTLPCASTPGASRSSMPRPMTILPSRPSRRRSSR